jgi:hypothetical protein
LVGREEVESQHVVRGLAGAPAIDPLAVAKLIAFPRFAEREPDEERDESTQEDHVAVHHAWGK